ncbi:hypothetical protein [Mesorhizobium huakuii]|uniref:hypothetical protein n=1 Tax=Mesorhizobium huakuii TaxID=28104 RepID=UPI0032B00CDE
MIPRDQRKDALNLLVDLLLKAVKAVVVRAVEVMHWIQHNCAIASRSGKALAWWTPAGFYVRHFYATEEEYRIETKLDGQRLQLRAHRIRKAATTREAAEALEQEIEAALSAYGMWPVPANQDPLAEPLEAYRHADTQEYRQPKHRTGTLREAARIALETHWHGMRSAKSVEPCLWRMVYFLESLGKYDLDLITSADLHAYVKRLREADNSPSFINQQLSHFHVVNEIAHKQTPPLCKIVLSIPREATRIVEKWWLRPEDQDRVSTWLRDPLSSYTDAMFADLIDFICMMEKLPRRYWSDAAAMRNHLMDRILDHARANWDDPKWKRIAYGICYGMGLRKVGGAPFRGRTGTP